MHEPLPHRTAAPIEVAVAHVLHRDIETRSKVSLKKVGAYKYATDPSTEVLCVAYAVDDGPVQLWLPGDPVPLEFLEAAADPSWVVCAHNDAFESAIEQHVLARRYGFPTIPIERHRCTMAICLALGLPARLGAVANALELVNRKDPDGERLMRQMSKPRKPRKGEDPPGTYYFDDPERLQRLYSHCKQDCAAGRELHNQLPPLSATEQALWALSSRINERGFRVHRQFAEAARRIARAAEPEIDAELAEITGGAVTAINQVTRLLRWLRQQGCTATKLDRKTIEKLLQDAELLPSPAVHRALEIRLGGAQAAVKKIDALLARAGADDRVRGAFRFHGAATGRWAGEGFQPQNLKRVTVKDLDAAIAAVRTGNYAHVRALYPRPLAVVGDCIRSTISAAPRHMLIGGDFNAIESRGLALVAGEQWKLDAYRRFDATRDPRDEPYCETACRIFGTPSGTYTKDTPERGIGKTCDLAFGYQGGLNAWRNFQPDKFTDAKVEQFKREWRAAHPATVKFWRDIDRAAVLAVRERGEIVRCGLIHLKSTGAFLQLKLPSGRKISYPQPRLVETKDGKHRVVFADNAAGQFVDCRHGQGAYGGLWTENIVSGIARDILAEAMLRIEAAGYPIVLHVHDEIVCEVPISFGSIEEFTRLMTRKPAWALELPIAASAWTGPRYCK
jgi:DNA polymerase